MAESVYKTALGWFNEKEKHPGTHKLLTNEEYDKMVDAVKLLKKEIKEAKENHLEEIDDLIDAYEDEIHTKTYGYEEIIKNLKTQVLIANKKAVEQTKLNENLLRISKERANEERNLGPQEKHTGYVVISSQEKEILHKQGKVSEKVVVWETVIQTPYSIEFTENTARNQISLELLTREGGFLLGKIGITQQYNIGFEKMMKEKRKEVLQKNTVFSQRLNANYKVGYWEYIALHTLPLSSVPKEMLIQN